ncbi:MAG: SDR family NAD(P)-dependent oxidoreductase [Planctomycetes bacterium]|nr:SDR family NAD(P)-dependent oxidoreductase [Planctomycetota bacterium]
MTSIPITGKSFLVTGGAGLIGSHIVEQLLGAGARRVVVLDNLSRGTLANLGSVLGHKAVEFHQIDIRDPKAILPLFADIDGVFHQAAIRITRCAEAPRECLDVLINGSFNVLECCVAQGVSKVVAASSASVYGLADSFPTAESHAPYNNRTWYGAAKVALEGMLRSFNDMYGLPYVALRYFNVYGPRMDMHGKYTEVLIRWLDCFDQGIAPKVFGAGRQTMDFVYVGDVARSNLLAMTAAASDEAVNVASGTETSLLELLQGLADAAGVRLEGALAPEFLPERKVNPVPRRLADISKARTLLGFTADVGLAEGLRRLLEWRRGSRTMAA